MSRLTSLSDGRLARGLGLMAITAAMSSGAIAQTRSSEQAVEGTSLRPVSPLPVQNAEEEPNGFVAAAGGGAFSDTGADNCNDAQVIPIEVGPPGAPSVTTVSGDNTPATGPDCTTLGSQTNWWEAISLDTCATIVVSYCGTSPTHEPINVRLHSVCPSSGTNCGQPRFASTGQGAPYCGDMNRWERWTNITPGTWYLPVSAEANLVNGRGPYQLQIRAEACMGACCNLDDGSCTDGVASTECIGPTRAFSAGQTCCRAECLQTGETYARSGVELLSQISVATFPGTSTEANDVWGYTSPGGREYAIIGLDRTTGFVDITDPFHPVIVADPSDSQSFWSDMKVYQQFAYNVNENSGGMQIFNLSQIDDGIVTQVGAFTGSGLQSVHTLTLNPDSGYAYLNGSNLNGGDLVILNLANPAAPTLVTPVGSSAGFYVHDSQVVSYTSGPYAGREIAFCYCISNDRIRIVDVTNKANRFVRSTITYPTMTGPHQGWLTTDKKHIIVDDEFDENGGTVSSATTYVFNVENLDAPFFVDAYTNGKCTIDHDLITDGDLVYKANYVSGLRIDDVSDINNAHEVAYFDTFPEGNSFNFDGAWGSFAGFPSGVALISDITRGLFVLSYDCNRNMIDDTDDIANLTSPDCNGNGLPDECEKDKARVAKAEASPVLKNRYLSFVPGNPGRNMAIRVKLASLVGFPGFNGEFRWVGPPQLYNDINAGSFYAAQLQCTPYFADWGAFGTIHAYGAEVVPSSSYEVQTLLNFCDQTTNESKYAAPLAVQTGKWGDVVAVFGGVGQPNFQDISAIVDAFQANPVAVAKRRVQLQPDVLNPASTVNFLDVSAGVGAFQGNPYPFAGPAACP